MLSRNQNNQPKNECPECGTEMEVRETADLLEGGKQEIRECKKCGHTIRRIK